MRNQLRARIGFVAAIAVLVTGVLGLAPSAATAAPVADRSMAAPDVRLPDGTIFRVPEAAQHQIQQAQAVLAETDPAAYRDAMAAYGEYLAAISDGIALEAPSTSGARACVTVTKSALIAFAWVAIGYGSLLAAVGGFLDLTIVGLPAGAVLNAVGIGNVFSGTVLLDRANAVKWSSKRVCV